MAAPIRFNNDYLRTFLYECHQMTHETFTNGRSVPKIREKQLKSYGNYQKLLLNDL